MEEIEALIPELTFSSHTHIHTLSSVIVIVLLDLFLIVGGKRTGLNVVPHVACAGPRLSEPHDEFKTGL